MRSLLVPLLLFMMPDAFAQKDFCTGSKGDPIYHQDFEGGNAALPSGFTNYDYVTWDPGDGEYTVSAEVGQDNTSWHPYFPNTTVSGGKALIVNADDQSSGRFFRTKISGLCQSTTYEFSAFLMNVYNVNSKVCEYNEIPVNVRFEVWDETEAILLSEMSTGDIYSTASPQWDRFGLTFQSQSGQQAIVLKIFNNGIGGCGNDLAIDDIIFRSCGDLTKVQSEEGLYDQLDLCEEDLPATVELTANSDHSVYSEHFYQWQASDDQENWQDLMGENDVTLNIRGITNSSYFRVKVAKDPNNLSGSYCNSASSPFLVNIVEKPGAPESNGDELICSNEPFPQLVVTAAPGERVDWYDQPSGGNLLAENTSAFYPETAGTYYAETLKEGISCEPGERTAVTLTVLPAPEDLQEESLYLCANSSLSLEAGLSGMTYLWSTGQTTRSIGVASPGDYFVEIFNSYGCSVVQEFEVAEVNLPKITEIKTKEEAVIIEVEQEGDFEFSLNGQSFQRSNIFESVNGGVYTAYVRNIHGCDTITRRFAHVVIPRFISPNNDGYNDYFEVKEVAFFGDSQIMIFNRYGKLIVAGKGDTFKWDGKIMGKELPADDYWYSIYMEGFEVIKGNFSLVR